MMMGLNPDRYSAWRKHTLAIAAVAWMLCFAVFTAPVWILPVHHVIESVGILLLALCVCGRVYSAAYISGYKDEGLIDKGPYSICRNPLYSFSIIGAAGVGASTGSVLASVTAALLTYAVFRNVVRNEEARLEYQHGEHYRAYLRRVPRFVPDFSLWERRQTIPVNEAGILRTFADSALFVLAVPIIDTFEFLKQSGVITVVYEIP